MQDASSAKHQCVLKSAFTLNISSRNQPWTRILCGRVVHDGVPMFYSNTSLSGQMSSVLHTGVDLLKRESVLTFIATLHYAPGLINEDTTVQYTTDTMQLITVVSCAYHEWRL